MSAQSGSEGKSERPGEARSQPQETETQQAASASGPAVQTGTEQTSVNVNDNNVTACYANFCRVSSTPEELILDLGLNPRPYATGSISIDVAQRIIMNHFTAKRLLSALSMALQRHEKAFGVLETDVRKRVKNQ